LASTPSLKVEILIDALRGTRSKGGHSSVSLLQPLVKEFGSRASISLYHTPTLGVAAKAVLPDRFREAFGLQHMKVYLFDDDLILSG
jgi:CDP-diacylglycerol--glycerol-3-phosphate 3-phosphatidyltransferase